MHARAVTSLFKASNVTITVSSAEQVEISAIRAKLGLERLPLYEKAPRAANGLQPDRNRDRNRDHGSGSIAPEPIPPPRTRSPAQATNSRLPRPAATSSRLNDEVSSPPPPAKSSLLLKRISANEKRDAPLPPPPANTSDAEDYELVNPPTSNMGSNIISRARGISMATTSDNISEYSADSQPIGYRPRPRGYSGQSSELGYLSSGISSPPPLFRTEAQEQAALSRAKWAREEAESNGSPASSTRKSKRGRTKSDIQREREEEEIEMARAAAEAAARRKYEKEQQALKDAEEEERERVRLRRLR